ncbi:MAG: ORF6N domain-containing protein [Flavobacteriales bacterium]|nr:ORF6N domain-containing protein [Flavobacteriales bacterium]
MGTLSIQQFAGRDKPVLEPLTRIVNEPPARYTPIAPPDAAITGRIHQVRGRRVLLDRDLAELYGVETKQLKRQVRRNLGRFPEDFMFDLTLEEAELSRSQIGTLKQGENIKYLPMAFTEQGVAMLSSVLNSEQAVLVNIHIIRVFTRMREVLLAHHEVLQKLEELEGRLSTHDEEIQAIFDHLTALVSPADRQSKPIGFKPSTH